MRTLIVGDTHLKQKVMLPIVDRAIEQHAVAQVVFTGDYCDAYNVGDEGFLEALGCLTEWRGRKEKAEIEVTLLYGNHDFPYLLDSELGISGSRMHLLPEIKQILTQKLRPQIAVCVDGWLITHAGLLQSWTDYCSIPEMGPCKVAESLNRMLKDERFEELFEDGRSGWSVDYGEIPSGPLWAFHNELSTDALRGVKQIVGHTPVSSCQRINLKPRIQHSNAEVWGCDTFSIGPNKELQGDGSLLLLENGILSVVKPSSLGYEGGWSTLYKEWERSTTAHYTETQGYIP